MKFGSILITVAAAALCLVDMTSASPVGALQRRATDNNKVIVGYFPNWLYGRYTPSMIDFSKYTHIYYAFAIQNTATTPTWSDSGLFDDYVQYGFPKLVSLAHAAGTKVTVSVGGWSGSTQFSTMAASASNRAAWIKWNVDFITKYGTDGVDIDWEYPDNIGAGCNAVNANDVPNLQTLVKELRAALDKAFPNNYKEITMAVHITPFGGQTPVTDVSGFVPYVDRFHVMSFDVNGAWNSTSGPNAPFHNQPGYGYPAGFVEGIESWKSAGVPYNKLAGGIAFYGRAQTLTVTSDPTTQYNPAVSPNPPLGDSLDGPWQDAYCSKDTTVASGVWRWTNMRSQGLLTSPTTAASPWVRHFDNITQTPWLYNPTNKQFISYDDPVSLGVKTNWAKSVGLAGLFVWSVEQDNGELLNAIAPMIAGNTKPTPTTTTASSTPTGSATITSSATPTSGTGNGCGGVAAWSASTAYNGGATVSYNGNVYQAQWWTQGETPGASANSYYVWKLVKAC
ncbi:glycoside hydrolase superfamily [Mycotypha africana]|uniref:glycoside hydrolase superfamily n=1 Tax=Mycotypha africana TaxID=64632 RepID=UPI002301E84A|nr:glycoside hydrolase superfamily [Mycotypha africana]KAI8968352.1 glycoside hydrolase superfamily [Mycotypha africana]